MTKKLISNAENPEGILVDLTAEEEAQRQTDIAEAEAEATAKAEAKEAKDNLRASAKAKLVAGEALTQEEADTIIL